MENETIGKGAAKKGILSRWSMLSLASALDVFDVICGLRPACRVTISESRLPDLLSTAEMAGLFAVASPDLVIQESTKEYPNYSNCAYLVPSRFVHNYDIGASRFCVLSWDRTIAVAATALVGEADVQGDLLGYPPCCVSKYAKNPAPQFDRTWEILAGKREASYLINTALAPLGWSLVPHFPCDLNCQQSLQLGRKRLQAVREIESTLAEALCRRLSGMLVYTRNEGFIMVTGWRSIGAGKYSIQDEFGPDTSDARSYLRTGPSTIVVQEDGAITIGEHDYRPGMARICFFR